MPIELRGVRSAPVVIGRHAAIGAGCVLLPGVALGEGCGVATLSLVKRDVRPFDKVAGVPARPIGRRSRRLLTLERQVYSW